MTRNLFIVLVTILAYRDEICSTLRSRVCWKSRCPYRAYSIHCVEL